MRLKTLICQILIVAILLPVAAGTADVDWRIKSKLQLSETPVDMGLSRDGQWLYLLTASGNLLVYSSQGVFNGKMAVGQGFDKIEAGPTRDDIYLLSSTKKEIQDIEVSYTMQIDTAGSPFRGPADAPVVIVEFTDFQCPYCARLGTTLDEIMKRYPGKIKIVYKSFPLNSHRYAYEAALAAMAAYEKGKFWEFYKALFDNYSQLNDAKITEIRKKFGLDTPAFDLLMNSEKVRTKVSEDAQEGIRLGVHGTPTVFINGKLLKNKRLEGFEEAIDKILGK